MQERAFFAHYELPTDKSPDLEPAQHQREALTAIRGWHERRAGERGGGILTIPTGGGKTFVAVRFLCQEPLSDGCKVLWLAHTHHLLEQAFDAYGEGVKHVVGRDELDVRTVSGAPGHHHISRVEPTDDVVIATIQTVQRAHQRGVPNFEEFLEEAGDDLFVVFDEAHHAPANTYRSLLQNLREEHTSLHLLGMTATPTYTDDEKRGWLWKLFSDGILHQSTASELIASNVLAEPKVEEVQLDFTPDFPADEYREWQRSNRDLPAHVVEQLAENRDRNVQIADHYAAHRDRYGKTLIFADRRTQCVMIETALNERGVDAASVMSRRDWEPPTPEERNRRTYDSNDEAIHAFREGELDVLVNVRMLTEGTDVPDAKSVFLTRKTTSRILLTQMVGRALRGPRFGGTERANLVAFIDDWRHLIQWAEFQELGGGLVDEAPDYAERPPVEWIRVDLLRQLARQMDSGANVSPAPYTEMLPVGWYRTEFEVAGDYDDVEHRRHLMMVYSHQREAVKSLIRELKSGVPDCFGLAPLEADDSRAAARVEQHLDDWLERFFDDPDELMDNVRPTLRNVARHMAQNNRVPPEFFRFEERDKHDLDAMAAQLIEQGVSRADEPKILKREYGQSDRLWDQFYPTFRHFKQAYDGVVNRIQSDLDGPVDPDEPETPDDIEPSQELKDEVIERDRWRCVCCDYDRERYLEVDHVRPYYLGGQPLRENLQTLCRHCNREKGAKFINFRTHATPLESPPDHCVIGRHAPDTKDQIKTPEWWHFYIARVVNFFYECDAVSDIEIGQRGEPLYHWKIHLFSGNDPGWLEPHLPNLVERARSAREDAGLTPAPESLKVFVRDELRTAFDVQAELGIESVR